MQSSYWKACDWKTYWCETFSNIDYEVFRGTFSRKKVENILQDGFLDCVYIAGT